MPCELWHNLTPTYLGVVKILTQGFWSHVSTFNQTEYFNFSFRWNIPIRFRSTTGEWKRGRFTQIKRTHFNLVNIQVDCFTNRLESNQISLTGTINWWEKINLKIKFSWTVSTFLTYNCHRLFPSCIYTWRDVQCDQKKIAKCL